MHIHALENGAFIAGLKNFFKRLKHGCYVSMQAAQCTSAHNMSRLQLVQNTLARVVAQKPRCCHITPVLIDLHWLPVRQRIEFKIATTAFKVLYYEQPSYLAEILQRYTRSRSLRSSASTTISVPLRKTSMVFSKSFSSVASNIWNKLPGHLSSVSTLPAFRKHLKYHLFL